MRRQATLLQVGCDHRSEMVHPAPNCLVGHRHSAFRQQIFDVAQAEGEPELEPFRWVNDLGREPLSGIADFRHALGQRAAESAASRRLRDNAVISRISFPPFNRGSSFSLANRYPETVG